MRKHHPGNERIKREYLTYLEQARGMASSSIDQVAAAIAQFEESTRHRDFHKFHRSQAIAFKEQLQDQVNARTGRPLAKATIHSRLMAVRDFVIWLAGKPGFRAKVSYQDADYFRPSANDERVAKAGRTRPAAALEDIRIALDAMPTATVLDRRDRAVFAFIVLSGARDNAIASFSLKHVDLDRRTVFQDAREVRTKAAKTFTSSFFPIDPIFEIVVREWIDELLALGHCPDDPLFPATEVAPGPDLKFVPVGLRRVHWKNADAIRRIVRRAFERVGLSYYHPHSFRHTLARHGEKICRTAEEWQAYSQNFGHSSPMTTFTSYGQVPQYRQAEILNQLAKNRDRAVSMDVDELSDDQVCDLLNGLANRFGRVTGYGPKTS